MKSRYTLGELAELLDLQCVGDQKLLLTGLATLSSASPDQLSFLANSKYLNAINDCRAGALILSPEVAATFSGNCLISEQPYLSYARASRLFEVRPHRLPGIHPTAVVSSHAQVAATASIGPHCVIGERAIIGDSVTIGPGCVIGDDSTISDGSLLHARVTLYQGVYVGHRAVIHSGAVIGSDGFGFAPTKQGWEKIAQLGGVRIGDDVEIGANTTIDRGALDDTVIGNGVIIDNLVQIAHNVTIGDYSAIAGCTGIAGSAKIGERCTLAGRSNIVGHISIADGTHVTANSMITKSIIRAGSYSSGTPMQETKDWKKNAVRFARLHEMYERLVKLEKRLK